MSRKLLNLCLTALMSVVCTAAWALSEVDGVYQIGTAADLEEFAVLVNDGNVFAKAVLTADIDRGLNGTMIGTEENRYQGTFEGAGHTININIDLPVQENNVALFRYTGPYAIIQNLKVTGEITTDLKFAGGLVARNRGIIRGCYVDVRINSNIVGDATHGGIVAVGNNGTLVENCLAKIAIVGATSQNSGGVVGWAEDRSNIVNCLVVSDESSFDLSTGYSCNIGRNTGNIKAIDPATYDSETYRNGGACYNNYVTKQWGDNVATTVVPYADLADGRICYQLNNDQSNIAWVQTIGTDPFPVPAAFGTGQVFASEATGCDGLSETATYSNSGTDQAAKHTFDSRGVCTNCGCFNFADYDFTVSPKFDTDHRTFLMGSVADIDAAESLNRVTNGFPYNMKMTDDITYIAEEGKYIFNYDDNVRGNFDGDGHTFTIGLNTGGRAALFPVMYGNVENLILHGDIHTSGANTGSLVGRGSMALVRNVFSDVNITSSVVGDNSSGGMFGWIGTQEKTVENCIYAGTFTLPGADAGATCARVGGFSGWTDTKTYFKNCAMLGNIKGAGNETLDTNTENSQNIGRNPGKVTTENVYVLHPIFGNAVSDHDKYIHYENEAGIASGELAFFLNGKQNGLQRFYQVIGTDPEPMPIEKEGALVYANAPEFRCDGEPLGETTYSNTYTPDPVIPDHNYVDGYCTVCGKFQDDYLTPVDGFYELSNGFDLKWWSIYASQHPDVCAKLMDDIDMSSYMDGYVPIATFTGEFDGQGHTISNFVINSSSDYQGLFSLIGNGAKIHDFIMDKTCSIKGNAFCGTIGGTSGGGQVYITNVGFEGTVTTTNQNAAGIVGVDQGGSMDMFITNCWVTGSITAGRESGAICGYSSGGSIVKNCWAAFSINESGIYDCDSFTRGGAQVVNCYEADIEGVDPNKQQHYRQMGANRATITLPLDDIVSGALCFNLNGKQFLDPTWYQTLEEDEHPYPFDNHGVVISAAGQFFSIPNSSLSEVIDEVQTAQQDAITDVLATQALIEAWQAAIDALNNVETLEAFAEAANVISEARAAVEASAAIYAAYIAECERVKDYLATHDDFAGDVRTALEAYLDEQVDGPSDDNLLGNYEYIIENHTATSEEIAAETERVTKWLAEAISTGYIAGSDVSDVLINSDFSKNNEGWTGGFGNSFGTTEDEAHNTIVGVEAWNVTGDQYQTVKGMKPGYYLIGTHAAFRPSNNRYSTNYAAGIYANGIFNYFPAVIEDAVAAADAIDGENCNLTVPSVDFPIYEDSVSTEGEDPMGYVVRGETGMAIAAKADRYKAYTIAYVGEDSLLTVGIKNPGTKYGSDWTGWSAIKMTYLQEDADDALTTVLENMGARAKSIINFKPSVENAASAPNFPAELKDQLKGYVAEIEETEGVEAKAALVKKFSDIFQAIYEGKQAYINLFDYASLLESFVLYNLALIEKDEEDGTWVENGEQLLSDDDIDAIYDVSDSMIEAYESGVCSTEEALNPETFIESGSVVAGIVPVLDEDGYYLIGTPKQFMAYRTIASEINKYAKGKLIADVDMNGVAMLPIGHNKGESAVHIFAGEFDGQGHTLANVIIDDSWFIGMQEGDPAALFYELQNATIKNFKLTGEFFTTHQFSGPITRWMSGRSTIDNVEIAVAFHIGANLAGDTSSGGVIGRNGSANSLISNCLVKTHIIGEGAEEGIGPHKYVGGVAGWADAALVMKNSLIISEYTNVGADGDNSQTIARGAGASATNVFVSQFFRGQQGTLVTPEQLASGEIAWKLNGSTGEDPHWFQKLDVDPAPYLFGSDVVYFYDGQYINEKPNIQLNAFAYNLDAKVIGNSVAVNFDLNAQAADVAVSFYNGEDLVYTTATPVAAAGNVFEAGPNTISVPVSAFGGLDPLTLNYKVEVTGIGTLEVTKVGESYDVWGPYGMAINNNPASKNFGQILLAESYPQEIGETYMSHNKPGAIYAFDPAFQPINAADGTPGFYGGLEIRGEDPLSIVGTSYKYEFKDLRFTDDGRLFVARASGLSNSSVFEINPEDLDEPWKPLFTGGELDEATGITYVGDEEQNRMALSLAFEGAGEDLKMYVLGGQRSTGGYFFTDYNCSIYNLGTATEWADVPSANFEPLDGVYTKSPVDVGIFADGLGGLWYIQRRSDVTAGSPATDETPEVPEVPALKHFDANGNVDYTNTNYTTVGSRIAVTTNGNYLAIPAADNTVVLYEVNYVPSLTGRITLTPKTSIKVGESRVTALAFDYADNLYVASASTETFSRYTIPYDNKLVVTPGNGIGLGVSGDVNCDGKVDIADVQFVLITIADGKQSPVCDVNGDGKVDVADVQTLLILIADQQ